MDIFGEQSTDEPRVLLRDQLAELRRELGMRQKNYPKWIEAGRMSEEQAKRQIAALEAVIRTLEIRPWPQVLELTKQWRDKAEGLSVLGVLAPKLHRDELLAVLAFAVDALRKAGIIGGKKP